MSFATFVQLCLLKVLSHTLIIRRLGYSNTLLLQLADKPVSILHFVVSDYSVLLLFSVLFAYFMLKFRSAIFTVLAILNHLSPGIFTPR